MNSSAAQQPILIAARQDKHWTCVSSSDHHLIHNSSYPTLIKDRRYLLAIPISLYNSSDLLFSCVSVTDKGVKTLVASDSQFFISKQGDKPLAMLNGTFQFHVKQEEQENKSLAQINAGQQQNNVNKSNTMYSIFEFYFTTNSQDNGGPSTRFKIQAYSLKTRSKLFETKLFEILSRKRNGTNLLGQKDTFASTSGHLFNYNSVVDSTRKHSLTESSGIRKRSNGEQRRIGKPLKMADLLHPQNVEMNSEFADLAKLVDTLPFQFIVQVQTC